ncbi:hypothetical protein cypCar_00022269 [Cyprinus carpio]|nr:hypothetical protein cypCar_00022269 [Cyprinus carpio]
MPTVRTPSAWRFGTRIMEVSGQKIKLADLGHGGSGAGFRGRHCAALNEERREHSWRSTYNPSAAWLSRCSDLPPSTPEYEQSGPQSQQGTAGDQCCQMINPSYCFLEASAKTGENVEDAFLEAAKKIYQNIQDGSLDLNAAESGVQHKPSAPQGGRLTSEPQPQREGCGC